MRFYVSGYSALYLNTLIKESRNLSFQFKVTGSCSGMRPVCTVCKVSKRYEFQQLKIPQIVLEICLTRILYTVVKSHLIQSVDLKQHNLHISQEFFSVICLRECSVAERPLCSSAPHDLPRVKNLFTVNCTLFPSNYHLLCSELLCSSH